MEELGSKEDGVGANQHKETSKAESPSRRRAFSGVWRHEECRSSRRSSRIECLLRRPVLRRHVADAADHDCQSRWHGRQGWWRILSELFTCLRLTKRSRLRRILARGDDPGADNVTLLTF